MATAAFDIDTEEHSMFAWMSGYLGLRDGAETYRVLVTNAVVFAVE
jgi:hypothetical protein